MFQVQHYIPENAALRETTTATHNITHGILVVSSEKNNRIAVTLTGNTHLHNITPYYTA